MQALMWLGSRPQASHFHNYNLRSEEAYDQG